MKVLRVIYNFFKMCFCLKFRSLFIFGFVLFWLLPLKGQNVVSKIYTGRSELPIQTQAQKEILETARLKISLQLIRSIVGSSKKIDIGLVKQKVIPLSDRYILREKIGKLAQRGNQWEGVIYLDISLPFLRQILLESGFFYEDIQNPQILSLISFVDTVNGQKFSWWMDAPSQEKAHLVTSMRNFHNQIIETFNEKGIFKLINEQKKWTEQTSKQKNTRFNKKHALKFAEQQKALAVIYGKITMQSQKKSPGSYQIKIMLDLIHVKNGRRIGGINQIYKTSFGSFYSVVQSNFAKVKKEISDRLVSQLDRVWKRGGFGSQIIELEVETKLNGTRVREFKSLLLSRVPSIKGLFEKTIHSRGINYTLDSFLPSQVLVDQIKSKSFIPFSLKVKNIKQNKIKILLK